MMPISVSTLVRVTCIAAILAGAACRPVVDRTRVSGEASAADATPVAVETLTGRTWMLRAWDEGEVAPQEPRVTLRYEDGRFTGRSGCNRYTASVMPGAALGAITVGTMAGTRMMCPEPTMGVEARFLAALQRAQTIGLRDPLRGHGGRLRIVYAGPQGPATLLFDETRAVAN